MGTYLSKMLDDVLDSSSAELVQPDTPKSAVTVDPRSPATVGVTRTPLPSAPALDNQAPLDPRSPCPGIPRTPLQMPLFDTPPDTPEPVPRLVLDPRSPSGEGVERTPIIAQCDVHRSWATADLSGEGDSLYPNPSSRLGGCDLDLSSDDIGDEHGSLENLLMYNSSLTDGGDSYTSSSTHALYSEESSCQVTPSVGEDGMAVSSCDVGDETEEEPTVSPIGSPVKKQSAPSDRLTSELSLENSQQTAIRASTPNSKSALRSATKRPQSRGLAHRDTNSPLSIIQRKQTHKINNQIVSSATSSNKSSRNNSFNVAQDKENMI